jgi:hypothetical protein
LKTRPILLRGYPRNCSKSIKAIERRLVVLEGRSVGLSFVPALTADRRRLYSNRPHGQPVHAGSFIRKRRIVLDQELEHQPSELARVLVHELFHFAWVRLGNPTRRSYEALVREEWKQRARGELGWSAESRKLTLLKGSLHTADMASWRDYLCESFCDSAAWIYSGVRRHPEYTLAARHRNRRAEWFKAAFQGGAIPI